MKACCHSTGQKEINPYHMEDNLWTHTLLVYNQLEDNIFNQPYKRRYLTALFHDMGKINTRGLFTSKSGKECVSFQGHEYASLQYLFNACSDPEFCSVDETKINIRDMIDSAILINNHNMFYSDIKNKKLYGYYNFDSSLLKDGEYFANLDKNGRFTIPGSKKLSTRIINIVDEDWNYTEQFINKDPSYVKREQKHCSIVGSLPSHKTPVGSLYNVSHEDITEDDIDVWIYCGIPGCGKDKIAAYNNNFIISLNNIRLDRYRKLGIKPHSDPKVEYKEAHKYFDLHKREINLINETKIELEKLRGVNNTIGVNESIAICNTNLKKKFRNQLTSIIRQVYGKDVKIGCKFIICDTEKCVERDLLREDKTVGRNIVEHFARNINLPTLREDFDLVSYQTNY